MLMLFILHLLMLVRAVPQLPTPSSAPPPLPMPPSETPLPIPNSPVPVPPPIPVPMTTMSQLPQPTGGGGGQAPTCECGFTYCASVLMAMKEPWSEQQLAQEYCTTPNSNCPNGTPGTNVNESLFLCLCDGPNKKRGDVLNLLCGCDKCLNIGPDYRGRCETPCLAGGQKMLL